MSAYVVDHETINRIVTAICADTIGRNAPLYGELGRLFGEPNDEQLEDLGVELLAMNQDAVMARYPDCDASNLPGPIDPPPYTFSHKPARLVQVYKSATCLRYQCSEGDVPHAALYKQLDEACNVLAAAIVSSLPEYEAAEWA